MIKKGKHSPSNLLSSPIAVMLLIYINDLFFFLLFPPLENFFLSLCIFTVFLLPSSWISWCFGAFNIMYERIILNYYYDVMPTFWQEIDKVKCIVNVLKWLTVQNNFIKITFSYYTQNILFKQSFNHLPRFFFFLMWFYI